MSSRSYDRGYDRGYTSRAPSRQERDYDSRRADARNIVYPEYVYGAAAPAADDFGDEKEAAFLKEERRRRNAARERSAPGSRRRGYMTPAMIAFMAAAMCVMAFCLFEYISLQSEVTSAVEEIADLESELSELKSDNDEALNAIESGISLDDIKYRAIAELGMTYADEDQIIHYSNEESDYVRQVIQPE